jgi:broad specificity phosphatase PhoE
MRSLFLLLLLWASGLSAQVTTIVLLRHAERLGKFTNMGLSRDGRRRAQALATELAPMQPLALYASDYLRTQQTLEPLSRSLGVPIRVRPRMSPEALAAEILREFHGGTVVVCGHSDTVGLLAHALGYSPGIAKVGEFDLLWVLRIGPEGFQSIEERRQPTPTP